MDLDAYLNRIGYNGKREPSKDALFAIHEAQLRHIPYENLDIHLSKTVSIDLEDVYQKLVLNKRGGWCYEMNSLLAWALETLGFNVTLIAGAVERASRGNTSLLNHLLLKVELDESYLVDTGFGDGFLKPLRIEEGKQTDGLRDFKLECLAASEGDGWWRLHNHALGAAKSYDFRLEARQLSDFADKCHELQTSPESGFVKTAVVQFFVEDKLYVLRGALLREIAADSFEDKVLESAADYEHALEHIFGLDIDNSAELYAKAWQQHLVWQASLT